ncbi:MAG: TIGR01212 family radical SAM protein [candidate division KSB1 bacterium]|nr:TIGR01212 family radical SAM protein [candidate division KSB1 bacterium]
MTRYNKFSTFLKQKYGEKVWKICIDAGLSCPHKSHNSNGCVFCRNDSFAGMTARTGLPIDVQVKEGIYTIKRSRNIRKFLVYFQTSTNTYGPIDTLEKMYNSALYSDDIVGISISTRPDCLPDHVLNVIQKLADKVDVWVELGLQSSHEHTLKFLNRGHTATDYLDAVVRLLKLPVRICTHVMIGLPNETLSDYIETAEFVSRSGVQEIKIHPLLILKNTPLAEYYVQQKIKPLVLKNYVDIVCNVIEHLHENMVIQRLTAEAPDELLIEPRWALNKLKVLNAVDQELYDRDSVQGRYYKG